MELPNYPTKKVTVDMDLEHKWYIEEYAHQHRITQAETLFLIIDSFIEAFPIKKDS